MGRLIDAALERVTATGARPWIVGLRDGPPGPQTLALPIDLAAALAPAAMVLPGQLLAEAVARVRGRDPDAPIGLSKVTLTR
jgi:glucosamine--fructose-6-phosphate aminotransferase (isomerizing)